MLWELDGYNYKTRVIGRKSRNQWVIADDFWDYQSVDPTGTTINKEIEIATVHINALNQDRDISIGAYDYLPLNILSMIHRRWGCIANLKSKTKGSGVVGRRKLGDVSGKQVTFQQPTPVCLKHEQTLLCSSCKKGDEDKVMDNPPVDEGPRYPTRYQKVRKGRKKGRSI